MPLARSLGHKTGYAEIHHANSAVGQDAQISLVQVGVEKPQFEDLVKERLKQQRRGLGPLRVAAGFRTVRQPSSLEKLHGEESSRGERPNHAGDFDATDALNLFPN